MGARDRPCTLSYQLNPRSVLGSFPYWSKNFAAACCLNALPRREYAGFASPSPARGREAIGEGADHMQTVFLSVGSRLRTILLAAMLGTATAAQALFRHSS